MKALSVIFGASHVELLGLLSSDGLGDDQRRRSEAGVSLFSVLPQPPEHGGAAALTCPHSSRSCRGILLKCLGLWTEMDGDEHCDQNSLRGGELDQLFAATQ